LKGSRPNFCFTKSHVKKVTDLCVSHRQHLKDASYLQDLFDSASALRVDVGKTASNGSEDQTSGVQQVVDHPSLGT